MSTSTKTCLNHWSNQKPDTYWNKICFVFFSKFSALILRTHLLSPGWVAELRKAFMRSINSLKEGIKGTESTLTATWSRWHHHWGIFILAIAIIEMSKLMGVCSEHKMLPDFVSVFITECHSWLLLVITTCFNVLVLYTSQLPEIQIQSNPIHVMALWCLFHLIWHFVPHDWSPAT